MLSLTIQHRIDMMTETAFILFYFMQNSSFPPLLVLQNVNDHLIAPA